MDKTHEAQEPLAASEVTKGIALGANSVYSAPDDFPIQKVLVSYFKTQDLGVLQQPNAWVTEDDREEFLLRIKNGQVRPDKSNKTWNEFRFLRAVPAQIDNPAPRRALVSQITSELNSASESSDLKTIVKLITRDKAGSVDPRYLDKYLTDNPTPEALNEYLGREIISRFSDPEEQRRLFTTADQLLSRLYGKRQRFYTQFKLLMNQAIPPEELQAQAETARIPRTPTFEGLRDSLAKGASATTEKITGNLAVRNAVLSRELGIEKVERERAEAQLAEANAKVAELERKIAILEAGGLDLDSPRTELYRRVGFWPGTFDGWSDDAVQTAITGMRRAQAKHRHQDVNGNGSADADLAYRRINAGLDDMSDPLKR